MAGALSYRCSNRDSLEWEKCYHASGRRRGLLSYSQVIRLWAKTASNALKSRSNVRLTCAACNAPLCSAKAFVLEKPVHSLSMPTTHSLQMVLLLFMSFIRTTGF
jgi:hypothetical protein